MGTVNMDASAMHTFVKKERWALIIGGIALIVFGVLSLIWPLVTLWLLTIFFAASVLVDGVTTLVTSFKNRAHSEHWWAWALLGVLGIVAGAIGLLLPAAAAGALMLLIAAYAIATGLTLIWIGIKLRKEIKGEWILWLMGAASVIFGVIFVMQPAVALLSLVWVIGAWAIAIGILKIMLAIRARSFGEAASPPPATSAAA